MADLIAISYPNLDTAHEVMQTLGRLQTEHAIELEDAVIVERRPDGKVKLHQSFHPTAAGAASGALWGGLIGLLFFAPLLGMAIGGAAGAAGGAMTDLGVDDEFMRELGEKLPEGGAAVFVLVHRSTPDKVLPQIERFGGHVLHTSLSNEAEERLRQALEHQTAGS